jgi:hypothetical protein
MPVSAWKRWLDISFTPWHVLRVGTGGTSAVKQVFIFIVFVVFGTAAVPHAQGDPAGPLRVAGPSGGDVKAQLNTAIVHAGFAGNGDSMGYVRQHLGHALNCIEGTSGKNFNRAWGHVCQGQGSGILQDLRATPGGPTFTLVIEHADSLAAAGLTRNDLAEARMAAKATAALLSVIEGNLR